MSETMSEAAPRFLEAICGSLGWAAGILWLVEPGGERMRAVDVWLDAASGERERWFAQNELESTTFVVGERLPGRAWEAGEPRWISEIPADSSHPKVRPVLDAGLRSVLVFPIKRGEEVLGVVEVLGRDITEPDSDLLEDCERFGRKVGEFIAREQAQNLVRASRDELELVLQHMPVGVTVVDPAGRYRFVNDLTARINNAKPEELVGLSAIEAISGLTILDEDGVEMSREDLPLFKALRGEPSPSQLVRFAGPAVNEQSWAIAHAIPLPGPLGDPRAVISVIENVTDVKSAEALLRASEARYREIADTLQRGLLPPDAGEIAGLDFDARLHTEEAGTRIGGDFYDVFQVEGDRYAIVIGDVAGKGVGAAGLTALARHTIRTAAMHDPRPAPVLRTLNRALLQVGLRRAVPDRDLRPGGAGRRRPRRHRGGRRPPPSPPRRRRGHGVTRSRRTAPCSGSSTSSSSTSARCAWSPTTRWCSSPTASPRRVSATRARAPRSPTRHCASCSPPAAARRRRGSPT